MQIATDDELKVLHRLTGWAIDHDYVLPGLAVTRVSLEDIYLGPDRGGQVSTPTTEPTTGSFQGLSDIKLIGWQVRFEQLSFWLNPIGAIFTIGFSTVFLLIFESTAGKSTVKALGGIKLIQYYVPGFIAYGIMSSCFSVLSIVIVNRREMGLLKRLRLSPVPRGSSCRPSSSAP